MIKTKVYIASDHAGFKMKNQLIKEFPDYDFIDLGTKSEDSVDYPDYAQSLSQKVLADKDSKGVLLCGSGIGMSIAANRYPDIRAALCLNVELAALSRKHNNSNILVLASRFTQDQEAKDIVKTWLETDFEAGRHSSRVDKIELF